MRLALACFGGHIANVKCRGAPLALERHRRRQQEALLDLSLGGLVDGLLPIGFWNRREQHDATDTAASLILNELICEHVVPVRVTQVKLELQRLSTHRFTRCHHFATAYLDLSGAHFNGGGRAYDVFAVDEDVKQVGARLLACPRNDHCTILRIIAGRLHLRRARAHLHRDCVLLNGSCVARVAHIVVDDQHQPAGGPNYRPERKLVRRDGR